MATKPEEFIVPKHIRDAAYQDGVEAAKLAYAKELKPRQEDYKGHYGYPRELADKLSNYFNPVPREDRPAIMAQKKEREELWFAWLRGWNEGGRDAMIDRLKLPNGKYGPAFLRTTFEENNNQRVVIDHIDMSKKKAYETMVYLKGARYPQSLTEVMPERRRETRDMFENTQDLISAAEGAIVEMQRILKTLKGVKK